MMERAFCHKCGLEFQGEYVTTPSDDGRYTYEWGPVCPRCGDEGHRLPEEKYETVW